MQVLKLPKEVQKERALQEKAANQARVKQQSDKNNSKTKMKGKNRESKKHRKKQDNIVEVRAWPLTACMTRADDAASCYGRMCIQRGFDNLQRGHLVTGGVVCRRRSPAYRKRGWQSPRPSGRRRPLLKRCRTSFPACPERCTGFTRSLSRSSPSCKTNLPQSIVHGESTRFTVPICIASPTCACTTIASQNPCSCLAPRIAAHFPSQTSICLSSERLPTWALAWR